MIKKTITYTDYNGVERTEDFYFNLNKAEALEMEMGITGGFAAWVEKIVAAKDQATLVKIFKDFVLKTYGEKSLDGKQFMKEDENGRPLYKNFMQTEAYVNLYMELATDDKAAAEFVNGVMPKGVNAKAAIPAAN